MVDNNNVEKPFWQSTKFYYALIAVGAFLALALTGTMTFTSEQTINFILGIFGFNVSAHALTNISAVIGQFFGRNGQSVGGSVRDNMDDGLPLMDINAPMPQVKSHKQHEDD